MTAAVPTDRRESTPTPAPHRTPPPAHPPYTIRLGGATRADPERGDVPGWVLVSVMSAGLVVLLWSLAGPLLTEVFEDAVRRVTDGF